MQAGRWKEERTIPLFFFFFLFNAQTGNLWSSSSSMLMHAFIAIEFSKTECMLTILMDLGQEQTCLVTLNKAEKINSKVDKLNTVQLRNLQLKILHLSEMCIAVKRPNYPD